MCLSRASVDLHVIFNLFAELMKGISPYGDHGNTDCPLMHHGDRVPRATIIKPVIGSIHRSTIVSPYSSLIVLINLSRPLNQPQGVVESMFYKH